MKKQLLLITFLLSVAVSAFSVEVEIDGLWYEVVSKTKEAKVIKSKNNNYYGDIVIPSSVKYEGTNYSVTNIGEEAFYACGGLTSITIGSRVKTIERAAIYYCWNLRSVTIPDSVTSIGDYAFSRCNSLISITIPGSVTNFGGAVFSDCSNLTKVTILNGVTCIGSGAFSYCGSLDSITIPNSVMSIGGSAFSQCRNLTSITIPSGIKSIEAYTFYNCSSLTSVTIPNSVISLDNSAFNMCSNLTTVTIGSGVQTINEKAFANCPELTDVYSYAEIVPSICADAFDGSYIEYVTLHVPTASIDNYKSIAPWSDFKTIMGLDGIIPETQKCAIPTISYINGKLQFGCETDEVEFISEITDADIKKYFDTTITLSATYNISVYATKSGYDNSETVTATLCRIDVEPKTEGIDNGIAQVRANAVLIQSNNGHITINGVDSGTQVTVFGVNGMQAGSALSTNGQVVLNTNLLSGSIAIIKIGEKSVKVVMQ